MRVVCLASGPSLTVEDLARVRFARVDGAVDYVIAINTTYQSALWADELYAGDRKWWVHHKGAADFFGWKTSILPTALPEFPSVVIMRNTGVFGLDAESDALRTGGNSGFAAINLAFHRGARQIILLGYDMQPGPNGEHHHHSDHPDGQHPNYPYYAPVFESIAEPLRALGVDVVNCTRQTALTAFRRAPLDGILPCSLRPSPSSFRTA